jgi:L-cystine transport system substrate-binding protein
VKKKVIISVIVVVVIVGGIFGIRAIQSGGDNNAVKKIQVANRLDYIPYSFVDETGSATGFEVDVLKAIDEKLPGYEFEYNATSDEDMLTGLKSGKYDIGVKGAWPTPERAVTYILPKESIAASVIGITYLSENKDKYKTLEDFAKEKGKLVPISPQSAQYNVIEEFNKSHPTSTINLIPSDTFEVSDAYNWILEKRYDAYFDIELQFNENTASADSPYYADRDKLSYVPYKGIETFPIIHRSEEDQVFADAYDEAIKELKAEGFLTSLSQKYFGKDVFSLVTK